MPKKWPWHAFFLLGKFLRFSDMSCNPFSGLSSAVLLLIAVFSGHDMVGNTPFGSQNGRIVKQ
jgi:hypothetical protein